MRDILGSSNPIFSSGAHRPRGLTNCSLRYLCLNVSHPLKNSVSTLMDFDVNRNSKVGQDQESNMAPKHPSSHRYT